MKLESPKLLALTLATFAFAAWAGAATLEVAQRNPAADDNGPGTADRPFKTLSKAAEAARAGDTVRVSDGIYRERVLIKASGTAASPITFEAAPAAHVVLTGADRMEGWKPVAGAQPVYQIPWSHRFIPWSKHMTHPGDDFHRAIGRCEQVLVDGYFLRQVLEAGQLAPGTFFVDTSNQVLMAWEPANRDLNKLFVEASVRQEILRGEGEHVHIRGFKFRYAANMAQHGAVVLGGRADRLEDCQLEGMNSSGAVFAGEDQVMRRCVFRDNGQLGFGAQGAHRLLFTDCLVENNNTKGFDRGWEAGGNKLVLCRDAVLERSRFVRNRGNGIWFDIGNERCTVRHCFIADNDDSGIFYEISFGLHAHDNVITGNGFASTPGAWGAQAGISISSSPDCLIERNLLVGNREGFNFREQTRSTPRIGDKTEVPVWNHDEVVRRNILALNRDAQLWGWFDVRDDRHWPGPTSARENATSATAKPGDQAAPYAAKNSAGQPTGLTLEKLHLQFDDNIYFAGPGNALFSWGVKWARHQTYPSLEAFRRDLGIDTASRVLDPGFADPNAADYRLTRQAMKSVEPCYPKGPVPGVLLGARD